MRISITITRSTKVTGSHADITLMSPTLTVDIVRRLSDSFLSVIKAPLRIVYGDVRVGESAIIHLDDDFTLFDEILISFEQDFAEMEKTKPPFVRDMTANIHSDMIMFEATILDVPAFLSNAEERTAHHSAA